MGGKVQDALNSAGESISGAAEGVKNTVTVSIMVLHCATQAIDDQLWPHSRIFPFMQGSK